MTFLIVHCAPSGLESPPTNVVNSTWKALRSEGSGYYDTVEPPLSPTSLQWPLFLTDSQYNDSCLNNRHLSTTATFFCPQGRRCGEVQLYEHFHVVYIVFFFLPSLLAFSVCHCFWPTILFRISSILTRLPRLLTPVEPLLTTPPQTQNGTPSHRTMTTNPTPRKHIHCQADITTKGFNKLPWSDLEQYALCFALQN